MEIELPREKLLRLGPKYLEMKELLSIILISGSKTESVFEIADRVIKDYGLDLSIFKSVEQIVEQLKIPIVKASQICSCVEIGRRIFDKNEDIFINSSKKIYENFKYLSNLKQIEFYMVILNNQNKIINKNLIYIGDNILNYNIKGLFKLLFEIDCYKFFIVCGSKNIDINKEYINFAVNLKDKSISMDVCFIDFIIIKDNSYISFKDKGII